MNANDVRLREVTADELKVAEGGTSDLGQKLQITLQEANNIYTRSAAKPAPTTGLEHEPKHR